MVGDMKKKIEDKVKKDEELYNEMTCYCEKTRAELEEAISSAKNESKNLSASITAASGTAGKEGAKAKNHVEKAKGLEEAIAELTEQNSKTQQESQNSIAELTSRVSVLKQAEHILTRGASLLQANPEVLSGLKAVLHNAAEVYRVASGKDLPNMGLGQFLQASTLQGSIAQAFDSNYDSVLSAARGLKLLEHFTKSTAFLQQPDGAANVAANAGGMDKVVGMVTHMLEAATEDLAESQAEKKKNTDTFNKMRTNMAEELKMHREAGDASALKSAEAKFKNTEGAKLLEKTLEKLATDEKTLTDLKVQCEQGERNYAVRQKMNNAELAAVSKALTMLEADDMRLMGSQRNFLQLKSSRNADWTGVQFKAMAESARRSMKKNISLVAAKKEEKEGESVFTIIINKIDESLGVLAQKDTDDEKHRNECIADINGLKKAIRDFQFQVQQLEATVAEREEQIQALEESIKEGNKNLADLRSMVDEAGFNRENENGEFQKKITDNETLKPMLQQVLKVLTDHFGDSFLQIEQKSSTQAPNFFDEEPEAEKTSGVVGMLKYELESMDKEAAEMRKEEKTAQNEYEVAMKEATTAIKETQESITQMEMQKEEADAERRAAKVDHSDTSDQLKATEETLSTRNADCEFILKYHEQRRDDRAEQADSLRDAKAMLAGMK